MKLSLVDVSVVAAGNDRSKVFKQSIELAQHVEKLGYSRVWYAEHHGAGMAAGRTPEVMIAAVAANTSHIRVGSGSVLLNHYSAMKVAETFCTLNELFPGRIDLGAGRATTGPVTDYALQQDRSKQFQSNSDEQITEVVAWLTDSFPDDHPFSKVPIATIDPRPNLYLLGSSAWSASAAAALGLKYVFAGFINQAGTKKILESYRRDFKPSSLPTGSKKPSVILSVHAVCADTEEEAQRQLAPVHIMYKDLQKGKIGSDLPLPDDAIKELGYIPTIEKYVFGSGIPPRFVAGTIYSVRKQLSELAHDLDVEEIMIQDMMTDHEARMHSYSLMSEVIGE